MGHSEGVGTMGQIGGKRRVWRALDALAIVVVAWGATAAVPATWFWYRPGLVLVSDGSLERPPHIDFTRTILRPADIKYSVVIRNLTTGEVACDPARGPFPYTPDAELPESIDLEWWSGNDARCWPRESGSYVMSTCWTVVRPVWGIVPPKSTCRESNPFRIVAVASEAAGRAIAEQRGLKEQIERLQQRIGVLESGVR